MNKDEIFEYLLDNLNFNFAEYNEEIYLDVTLENEEISSIQFPVATLFEIIANRIRDGY